MTYRLGGKGTGCGSLSSGDFTSRAKTCITNLLVIGLLGTLTLLGVPQSAQAGEAGGTDTDLESAITWPGATGPVNTDPDIRADPEPTTPAGAGKPGTEPESPDDHDLRRR